MKCHRCNRYSLPPNTVQRGERRKARLLHRRFTFGSHVCWRFRPYDRRHRLSDTAWYRFALWDGDIW